MTEEILQIDVLEHFGLPRDPFGTIQGTREIFRSERHSRIVRQIEAWLMAGEICGLLGHVGSGKSTLVADLELRSATTALEVVRVGHPDREQMLVAPTIYEAVNAHFAGRHGGGAMPRNCQRRVYWFKNLLGVVFPAARLGLIVDEAHRLSSTFLKGLKEITEHDFGGGKILVGVLLVGQPALRSNLQTYTPDVYKRMIVGDKLLDMGNFDAAEVGKYLLARTGNREVFHRGAVAAIARCADTPLDINKWAWDGMRAAYRAGSNIVKWNHVLGKMTLCEKVTASRLDCGKIAEISGVSIGAASEAINGKYRGRNRIEERIIAALDEYLSGESNPRAAAAG